MWTTKVFNPGPPRIGRLSKNIVLPRSVPLPALLAGAGGALLGLLLGLLVSVIPFIDVGLAGGVGTGLGAALGVGLVTIQPWEGEYINRIVSVRLMAYISSKRLACPGSGMPAVHDEDIGSLACPYCGRAHSSYEQITPEHVWRRRVYLGMQPIPHPPTGEVRIVPGSLPKKTLPNKKASPLPKTPYVQSRQARNR